MMDVVYRVSCRKPIDPSDKFCRNCGADQHPLSQQTSLASTTVAKPVATKSRGNSARLIVLLSMIFCAVAGLSFYTIGQRRLEPTKSAASPQNSNTAPQMPVELSDNDRYRNYIKAIIGYLPADEPLEVLKIRYEALKRLGISQQARTMLMQEDFASKLQSAPPDDLVRSFDTILSVINEPSAIQTRNALFEGKSLEEIASSAASYLAGHGRL